MNIRHCYQLLGIIFILFTLASYTTLGGDAFPDYENYITIAENRGWLFQENEYFFEWISRGLLIYLPLLGFSPKSSVDVLAAVNQLVCTAIFLWLMFSKEKEKNVGATLLFSLIGFLLLTTTIRAAPCYLALTVLACRNLKLDLFGLCILLFGLAWHDSFLILAAFVLLSGTIANTKALERALSNPLIHNAIYILSATALLFSNQLRDTILSLIGFDAGIRAVYFDGDGAQSTIKLVYCMIAIIVCATTFNDAKVHIRNRILATMLSVGIAAFYIISGTAAVRFSMFAFCAFIPLRGVYAFNFERLASVRLIGFFAAIVLFILSTIDTLSQTQ